jgi:hypothetical protein
MASFWLQGRDLDRKFRKLALPSEYAVHQPLLRCARNELRCARNEFLMTKTETEDRSHNMALSLHPLRALAGRTVTVLRCTRQPRQWRGSFLRHLPGRCDGLYRLGSVLASGPSCDKSRDGNEGEN